jgi:hypothetical protein
MVRAAVFSTAADSDFQEITLRFGRKPMQQARAARLGRASGELAGNHLQKTVRVQLKNGARDASR